jgi:hypothetical protein
VSKSLNPPIFDVVTLKTAIVRKNLATSAPTVQSTRQMAGRMGRLSLKKVLGSLYSSARSGLHLGLLAR